MNTDVISPSYLRTVQVLVILLLGSTKELDRAIYVDSDQRWAFIKIRMARGTKKQAVRGIVRADGKVERVIDVRCFELGFQSVVDQMGRLQRETFFTTNFASIASLWTSSLQLLLERVLLCR